MKSVAHPSPQIIVKVWLCLCFLKGKWLTCILLGCFSIEILLPGDSAKAGAKNALGTFPFTGVFNSKNDHLFEKWSLFLNFLCISQGKFV